MKPLLTKLVVVAIASATGEFSQAQPANTNIVLGYIYKGYAYATLKDEKSLKLHLVYGKLPNGELGKTIAYGVSDSELNRWQIAHGRLWSVTTNPTFRRFFGDCYSCIFLDDLKGGKLCLGPLEGDDDLRVSYQGGFIPGGVDQLSDVGFASIGARYPVVAHYDYVPLSQQAVQLFFLCNTNARRVRVDESTFETVGDLRSEKWNFHAITYNSATCEVDGHKAWSVGKWSDKEKLKVMFKEPFYPFVSRGDYFFVTESGKLYFSRKPTGKEVRDVEAVWQNAKKPITHIITDVDENRVYVFGRLPKEDGAKQRMFFFILSAQPVLESFDGDSLKPVDGQEPLHRVMQLANILSARAARVKELDGLKNDAKLGIKLTIVENAPKLRSMLANLDKATGLTLTIDANLHDHEPIFGNLELRNVEAYHILHLVAKTQLDKGNWKKTEDGYRLVANASTAGKDEAKKLAETQRREAAYGKFHPLGLDLTLHIPLRIPNKKMAVAQVPSFNCPSDPTLVSGIDPVTGYAPSSYAANFLVFGNVNRDFTSVNAQGVPRLAATFRDGTSQTILFAEKYSSAWVKETSGNMEYHGGCHWSYMHADCQNPLLAYYDPATAFGTSNTDGNAIGPTSLTDPRNGRFQVQPNPEGGCNPCLPATGHIAMNVCMGDGSGRSLSGDIAPLIWWALLTPASGDIAGGD